MEDHHEEDLPPPPPPFPPPNLDAFTLETIRVLGFSPEQVYSSPWGFISRLLTQVVDMQQKHNQERLLWEISLKQEKLAVEEVQQNNLLLLTEMADKLSEPVAPVNSKSLEEEVSRLQLALALAQTECTRLSTIATFSSLSTDTEFTKQAALQSELESQLVKSNESVQKLQFENATLLEQVEDIKLHMTRMKLEMDRQMHELLKAQAYAQSQEEAKLKADVLLARAQEEAKLATDLLVEERRTRSTVQMTVEHRSKALELCRAEVVELQTQLQESLSAQQANENKLAVFKRHMAKLDETTQRLEHEMKKLSKEKETLEEMLESERRQHQLRLQEVKHAALDISNMSKENRELSQVNEKLGNATREARSELDVLSEKYLRLSSQLDVSRMEHAELSHLYAKVCLELSQTKEALKECSNHVAKLNTQIRAEQDKHIEEARQRSELTVLNRNYKIDVDTLERTRETLTRENRLLRIQLEENKDTQLIAQRMQGTDANKVFALQKQVDELKRELATTKMELVSSLSRVQVLREDYSGLSSSSSKATRPSVAPPATSAAAEVSSTSSSSFSALQGSYFDDVDRVLGGSENSSSDLLSEAGSVIRSIQLERTNQQQQRKGGPLLRGARAF